MGIMSITRSAFIPGTSSTLGNLSRNSPLLLRSKRLDKCSGVAVHCRRKRFHQDLRARFNEKMSSSSATDRQKSQPCIVQIGTGCDLHGQDATLAAVRACKGTLCETASCSPFPSPLSVRYLALRDPSLYSVDVLQAIPSFLFFSFYSE